MANVKKKQKEENTNLELALRFKQTTGLNIFDFKYGINPREVYRNSSDCLINIFYREKVTYRRLIFIFNYFGESIYKEYINDLYLRNKTNLTRNSYGVIEDHVNRISEEDFKNILTKYVKNEVLNEKEKCILMGAFQKCAELLDIYKYPNFIPHYRNIKAELDIGIFENIVVKGKSYTYKERKNLRKLSYVWNRDTLNKYENLDLLKQRLIGKNDSSEDIKIIDSIRKLKLEYICNHAIKVKEKLDDLYLKYEISNRKDIIKKVYEPPYKKGNIVINNLLKMGNGAILHFCGVYSKIFEFENYLYKLEEKYNKKFSLEEKESMRKSFETKNNNFIVNRSVDLNAIGQSENGEYYNVNTSNQLSCMFITPENILKMKGTRGNLALGFSKDKLTPDLIATISNKNIHSNKNIECLEAENDFKDFSCSFNELLNMPEGELNTELVMFRNTELSTLKPSYLLYISYRDINSEGERQNIKFYKEKMREAGLVDIPIVIFDTYTINKEIKEKENNKEIEER